jgi:hypothetical protein
MLQGAGISAWSRPSAAAFATSPWADAVSGRLQLTLRELAESLQRGSRQQCAKSRLVRCSSVRALVAGMQLTAARRSCNGRPWKMAREFSCVHARGSDEQRKLDDCKSLANRRCKRPGVLRFE